MEVKKRSDPANNKNQHGQVKSIDKVSADELSCFNKMVINSGFRKIQLNGNLFMG